MKVDDEHMLVFRVNMFYKARLFIQYYVTLISKLDELVFM